MPSPEEYSETAELREALARTQRQLFRAKATTDQMVERAIEAARDAVLALGPIKEVKPPTKDPRRGGEEAALWHLTDWQGAKKTPSYNSSVMRARVMEFATKARKITEIQRADHPVRECVIAFGGDMIEGLFQFPSQPFEIDATIFEQWANVSRLIVDVVREALSVYDRVLVIAEWGNHGRIGNKRAVVPRSDNFDRMCYEHARQLLAGQSRLSWQDCPEDIQRIEIGAYRALLIHGDEVGRNGFASPMTIVQHINRWRSGAYPWDFRDCYIGHYHNHAEWPMANGEGAVFQTGSIESENRYAGVMLASQAKPSQRLHFIDKKQGFVTSQFKVRLT